MNTIHDRRRELAFAIVDYLKPFCQRIEIAGAIRRGSLEVRDIDIVLEPLRQSGRNLFGEMVDAGFHPDFHMAMITLPNVAKLVYLRGGERMRVYQSHKLECNVDIFIVGFPASWGATLAIRTGPAVFSKLLVTSRLDGGAMPPGMKQDQGCLWRGGVRLDTDSEEEWFQAIGVPCWAPPDRTEQKLRSWLERRSTRIPNWR